MNKLLERVPIPVKESIEEPSAKVWSSNACYIKTLVVVFWMCKCIGPCVKHGKLTVVERVVVFTRPQCCCHARINAVREVAKSLL